MVIATTERLVFKPITEAEAKGLYQLTCNPDINRVTGDRRFKSIDDAAQLIRQYQDYSQHGFGRWAIYLRDTHDFVGFCGLKREPGTGHVDLSFRLLPQHWGRGLASEAAAKALELGFYKFGLKRIIARAMMANHKPHAIFAKLGMRKSHCFNLDEQPWALYAIEAQEFYASRALDKCC